MIKLNAMPSSSHFFRSLVLLLVLLIPPAAVQAQAQPAAPVIISPRAGEAVIGRIEISGGDRPLRVPARGSGISLHE